MEEGRKRLIEGLVFAVSMVIIVGIMFFNFFTQIKREGEDYYKNQMTAIASGHAEKINTELEMVRAAGETAAYWLSSKANPSRNDILNTASALLETTSASRIIYHGGGEYGTEWDGERLRVQNLTEQIYFEEIFEVSDSRFVYIEDKNADREEILLIVPVEGSTDKNLLIFYPVENFYSMMRVTSEFEAETFAALIDADGTIITDSSYVSGYLAGSNLWDNVAEDYSGEIAKAKGQIAYQMTGVLKVGLKEGEEDKTLIYVPIRINDWVMIIGVDQDYVHKREMRYWRRSSSMLYQLLGVLLFFFAIFLAVNFIGKKKNAERDRELREKADTDLLTGLTNKLATERMIKEYMAENPDALAMMFVLDIDNFKKINDTMGHAFGDEVIRLLGRNIGSIFRVTDIIGRTGGDEFTIFLKFLKNDENTLKEAKKLADFFKDFTAGEYVKYSVTASIGAAVFPAHGSDFYTLYKAADKALYKAKQRGKNQLAFYDDRDRAGEETSGQT